MLIGVGMCQTMVKDNFQCEKCSLVCQNSAEQCASKSRIYIDLTPKLSGHRNYENDMILYW